MERITIIACGSSYHVGVIGKYNLEKMKEPLLVIDGRLADRFDIDPSEILQIRPISPIEKEVGYYPNAEVIINTK